MVTSMSNQTRRPRRHAQRNGFTLIELLIVLAVILVLAGLIIVGLNKAMIAGQGARTRTLMNSIKQGLVRFESDFGYLPPVLGSVNPSAPDDLRAHFDPPDFTAGDFDDRAQEWFSITTLAEYMVGYGNHNEDGYGAVGGIWSDESPPTGIRDPQRDGVWNATSYGGLLEDRMLANNGVHITDEADASNRDRGQVYGPYIELDDERLLGSTNGTINASTGEYNVAFPGESGYNAANPKVICDYWGNPIRYYRTPYQMGAINVRLRDADYNADGDNDILPSLSDVFVLRPWEVVQSEGIDTRFRDDGVFNGSGDTVSTQALEQAQYALFSAGPDKALNERSRVDEDQFNKDNIVEIGP